MDVKLILENHDIYELELCHKKGEGERVAYDGCC